MIVFEVYMFVFHSLILLPNKDDKLSPNKSFIMNNNDFSRKPNEYSSLSSIQEWNSTHDRFNQVPIPPRYQTSKLDPVQVTSIKPYVNPNPIADFFCAPSHSTPWPQPTVKIF